MTTMDYLSYSRINTFLTCPLRFQFRYIDHLDPEFTPSALVFGTGIHAAIAVYYRSMMNGAPVPSHAELMAAFDQAWAAGTSEGAPVKYKEDEDPTSLRELAAAMLQRFLDEARPVQVSGVEVPFRFPLADGLDLVGVVDLVEVDDEGRFTLVDHKTSARKYSDGQAQDSLQLGIYALAAEALTGQTDTLVRFDVLLKSKNGNGGVQRQYGIRTPGDTARVRKIASRVADAIETEVFYPNAGWQCAGCEFRGACDQWAE